jgi:GT2 family glycosyltransferase
MSANAHSAAGSAPRVTIILVNWNGRDVTLDCLASLRELTYPNRSIVVVDNTSTDGSVDAIRSTYPEVEILVLKENRRFAGGNNEGMRHALAGGTDLILLLNNDTIVDRDFLGPMIERLQADSSTGMVVPKIYYSSPPDRIWYAGGVVSFWTGTMRHLGIREVDTGQYDAARSTEYATGCCILTSRQVVERVGMLDERYFMYAEDADWSMRIRRAGYTIQYEPRAKIWHRLSASAGGHLSWYKMENKFLSNFRFFARYAAWYQWLVFPWLSIIVNGVSAIRYLISTRG